MPEHLMKWGYATTAAIVRSLQKDQFYRRQLQNELKLILLDHLRKKCYYVINCVCDDHSVLSLIINPIYNPSNYDPSSHYTPKLF